MCVNKFFLITLNNLSLSKLFWHTKIVPRGVLLDEDILCLLRSLFCMVVLVGVALCFQNIFVKNTSGGLPLTQIILYTIFSLLFVISYTFEDSVLFLWYRLYYYYIYIYIYIYISYIYIYHIYIYIYIYIMYLPPMTYMFPFPLCMFSDTNLLNMLLISGIKRVIGTKIGVNNLESLYL